MARALSIPSLAMRAGDASPEPAAPVIDEKSPAYQAGLAAGREENAAQLASYAQNNEALATAFTAKLEEIDSYYRGEYLHAAARMIEALGPKLMRAAILDVIDEVLRSHLSRRPERITIAVHPDMKEPVSALLEKAHADEALVGVETNADQPVHAVDIKWEKGGLVYDLDAMAEQINALLIEDQSAMGSES